MIYQLNPDTIDFPDPREGEDDGLFAVGGDLSTERLLLAYQHGIFPWYAYRKEDNHFRDDTGEPWIQWWCPMQRFVIPTDEIHISHSMRTLIRKQRYVFSVNSAFHDVITHCGSLRDKEEGAWLGPHIVDAYERLHKLGVAMSVEVWEKNDDGRRLVGGLYGVLTSNIFVGESMFSLVPSASKLALIFLAGFLREHGVALIDCQLHTPHLESMGGRFISYNEYMEVMKSDLSPGSSYHQD